MKMFVDCGETTAEPLGITVANIKEGVVFVRAGRLLDLVENAASYYVTGSKLAIRMEVGPKSATCAITKYRPLPTESLSKEKS
jgi:hypothetical protein